MKRLVRKAGFDYTQAKGYTSENDIHWQNISSNMWGLPSELQNQLTDALMNYSTDTSEYYGEHPLSIIAMWRNQPELTEQLDAQQMTTLTIGLMPEIQVLNLGGISQ